MSERVRDIGFSFSTAGTCGLNIAIFRISFSEVKGLGIFHWGVQLSLVAMSQSRGCITKVRACDVEHVFLPHTACARYITAANHVHSLSYHQAVLNLYKMTQPGLFLFAIIFDVPSF